MKFFLPALLSVMGIFTAALAAEPNTQFVTILAGESAWMSQASELAAKLDHENGLRLLPVMGVGGVQALVDLTKIPSLDAALVASDSLVYAKSQNLIPESGDTLSYVAKIAPLEIILIARNDLKNVTALAGKRIATGPAQSAEFATGELIFNAFELPFTRVPRQNVAAVQALIDGEADAALFLGHAFPAGLLNKNKFHIVALPLPPVLQEIYQPALLTAVQLPTLMETNSNIETIAASLTLAVKNSARGSAQYNALRTFEIQMFKAQADGLSANLAATIPGWTRHSSAQDLLDQTSTGAQSSELVTPTGGEP
jgi:TRAP-type uncharacterized transport system substrate-binding protein